MVSKIIHFPKSDISKLIDDLGERLISFEEHYQFLVQLRTFRYLKLRQVDGWIEQMDKARKILTDKKVQAGRRLDDFERVLDNPVAARKARNKFAIGLDRLAADYDQFIADMDALLKSTKKSP